MAGEYLVRRPQDVAPVPCPCGEARRIITAEHNEHVSIHRVKICGEAKKHYHRRLTEYYVILEGTGEIELGDDKVPVEPGAVIMIPAGTAHALRGEFEIINIVSPPFDPEDEHLVDG